MEEITCSKESFIAVKQHKVFPYLVFFLTAFLLLWTVLHFYLLHNSNFFVVSVEGKEIGLVSSENEMDEILAGIQREASVLHGRPVKIAEKVEASEVFSPLEEVDYEQLTAALRGELSFQVQAHMITVEGEDIFPLNSHADKENMLIKISQAFAPDNDSASLEKVEIAEEISSRSVFCKPNEIKDAVEVAQLLLNGGERQETYLVSRGDTLSTIAHTEDVSLDDIQELNPHVEEDALRQGEELALNTSDPLVTVITEEEKVKKEEIEYETEHIEDNELWKERTEVVEEGKTGLKEVTYRVISENGMEIQREKVEEKVIKEPSNKVVARGTAEVPSRGTGSFIWPVEGEGRITSGYGWRGRGYHEGVDIASSSGTPILSADDGVVVFSGWDGGYGNTIVIQHGKYYTRYAHNSQNSVSVGTAVSKGQVIGYMGSTGRSTGSHLHFEVRSGGKYGPTYNPMDFY